MLKPNLAVAAAILSLPWLLPTTLLSQTAVPYKLQAGDDVQIRFFYDPELNTDATIRPDGTLSLALLGDATLSGKTPAQASAELETRYAAILKKPSITIQVRNFANLRVYVGGEVNRPGTIPLTGSRTVLEAVLEAGGTRHTASDVAILIRHTPDGKPYAQRVSVRSVNRTVPEAARLTLQPFDVVLLPESKIARVDRWVDQYIRQVLPGTLNGGFSYLINGLNGNLLP